MEKYINSILEQLVEICKERQHINFTHFTYFSPKKYVKEYCTIKLCSGRQAGHTTAALNLIEKLKVPSVYIIPKKEEIRLKAKTISEKFDIVSLNQIKNYSFLIGKSYQLAIVDWTFGFSESEKNFIIENITECFKFNLLKKENCYLIFLQ